MNTFVINRETREKVPVEILPVENSDYKILKREKYYFDWIKEKRYNTFKLQIKETREILGVISYEEISNEWRHHIRLLSTSKENVGKFKKYEDIAGQLISFVGEDAILKYGELACISLRPKTRLAKHYIQKYNMTLTGMTISIMMPEIISLVKKYRQ